MNILAYNIIRKMVENPLEVEYKEVDSFTGRLYIKGKFILRTHQFSYSDALVSVGNNLSNDELKKILSVVDHCEAIKIRNL